MPESATQLKLDEQFVLAKEALREELIKCLDHSFCLPSYVNRVAFMEHMFKKYLEGAVDAIDNEYDDFEDSDSATFLVPDISAGLLEPERANHSGYGDELHERVVFYRERMYIPENLTEVSDRMLGLLRSSEYLRDRVREMCRN